MLEICWCALDLQRIKTGLDCFDQNYLCLLNHANATISQNAHRNAHLDLLVGLVRILQARNIEIFSSVRLHIAALLQYKWMSTILKKPIIILVMWCEYKSIIFSHYPPIQRRAWAWCSVFIVHAAHLFHLRIILCPTRVRSWKLDLQVRVFHFCLLQSHITYLLWIDVTPNQKRIRWSQCRSLVIVTNTNWHTDFKTSLISPFAGVDDELIRPNRRPSVTKGPIEFSTKTPHLILTLLPTDRLENSNKKNRKKRAAADATTCARYR